MLVTAPKGTLCPVEKCRICFIHGLVTIVAIDYIPVVSVNLPHNSSEWDTLCPYSLLDEICPICFLGSLPWQLFHTSGKTSA